MSDFINRSQPISTEEIFRNIRKRISKLELPPGTKLSENQMCKEYGVSRSVIRTVFIRLNQLKLLDIYPQRGTYVSLINLNHIAEILLLRTAVEKEIITEIMKELKEEDFERMVMALEENLKEQENYKDATYYCSDFKKLDSAFHQILLDSINKYDFVELLSDQLVHISRWRNFDVALEHRVTGLIEEHGAIMEAIKAHDEVGAREEMSKHLASIYKIGEHAKQVHPEYFI